ncbi:hypothetical protein Pelo_13841 [Pelomyxa schiedti]|nr:hypothetical protein Pelo_13841 [Pelomyxa schiedti]
MGGGRGAGYSGVAEPPSDLDEWLWLGTEEWVISSASGARVAKDAGSLRRLSVGAMEVIKAASAVDSCNIDDSLLLDLLLDLLRIMGPETTDWDNIMPYLETIPFVFLETRMDKFQEIFIGPYPQKWKWFLCRSLVELVADRIGTVAPNTPIGHFEWQPCGMCHNGVERLCPRYVGSECGRALYVSHACQCGTAKTDNRGHLVGSRYYTRFGRGHLINSFVTPPICARKPQFQYCVISQDLAEKVEDAGLRSFGSAMFSAHNGLKKTAISPLTTDILPKVRGMAHKPASLVPAVNVWMAWHTVTVPGLLTASSLLQCSAGQEQVQRTSRIACACSTETGANPNLIHNRGVTLIESINTDDNFSSIPGHSTVIHAISSNVESSSAHVLLPEVQEHPPNGVAVLVPLRIIILAG